MQTGTQVSSMKSVIEFAIETFSESNPRMKPAVTNMP